MKLPRWFVALLWMTSGLTIAATPIWWWVSWPQRTARDFIALMADERYQAARAMLTDTMDDHAKDLIVEGGGYGPEIWNQSRVIFHPRTWSELLQGRQEFTMEAVDAYIFSAWKSELDWRFSWSDH